MLLIKLLGLLPQFRIRITQRRKISGTRLRVQLAQQGVIALLRFNLDDPAVVIVDVAEDNRLGRA